MRRVSIAPRLHGDSSPALAPDDSRPTRPTSQQNGHAGKSSSSSPPSNHRHSLSSASAAVQGIVGKVWRRSSQRVWRTSVGQGLWSACLLLVALRDRHRRFEKQCGHSWFFASCFEPDGAALQRALFHLVATPCFVLFSFFQLVLWLPTAGGNWAAHRTPDYWHSWFPYVMTKRSTYEAKCREDFLLRLSRDSLALECAQLKMDLRRMREQLKQQEVMSLELRARSNSAACVLDASLPCAMAMKDVDLLKLEVLSSRKEKAELLQQLQTMRSELDCVQLQYQNLLKGADHILEHVQHSVEQKEHEHQDDMKSLHSELSNANKDRSDLIGQLQEAKAELASLQETYQQVLAGSQQAVHSVVAPTEVQWLGLNEDSAILRKERDEMDRLVQFYQAETSKLTEERVLLQEENSQLQQRLSQMARLNSQLMHRLKDPVDLTER